MSTRTVVDFAMPSLGADMDEGRITEWLVQPGDRVERGQIVVVVETEKSDIEVEVFEPGVIAELLVGEGERVPVGTPIARIESTGGARRPQRKSTAGAGLRQTESRDVSTAEQPGGGAGLQPCGHPAAEPSVPKPYAHVTSPVIRHLAEHLHVDTTAVHGSGPGGRVHRDDVQRAAEPEARPRITPRARRLLAEHGREAPQAFEPPVLTGDDVLAMLATPPPAAPAAPAPSKADRAETMRRHIANLMTRSWHEIPHYHVTKRLDLSSLTAALAERNAERPLAERVVPGAVLLSAAARAAAAVPACNGWWRDERFEPAPSVALGVVLSLRTGGIVVPTIEGADHLTADELMARLGELVQRARQGRLRASDMSEASITVTNLGDLGGESVSGVIHPPQVVLVGFGAVHDEVWAIDGQAMVRPTVVATLAGDHRAIDGLTGSRYLTQLQAAIDRPFPEG